MNEMNLWIQLLTKIHTHPIGPSNVKKITLGLQLHPDSFPYDISDFVYKDEIYCVTKGNLGDLANAAIEHAIGPVPDISYDLFASAVPDLMTQVQYYLTEEQERIEKVLDCDIYVIETEGPDPQQYCVAVWPRGGM